MLGSQVRDHIKVVTIIMRMIIIGIGGSSLEWKVVL